MNIKDASHAIMQLCTIINVDGFFITPKEIVKALEYESILSEEESFEMIEFLKSFE